MMNRRSSTLTGKHSCFWCRTSGIFTDPSIHSYDKRTKMADHYQGNPDWKNRDHYGTFQIYKHAIDNILVGELINVQLTEVVDASVLGCTLPSEIYGGPFLKSSGPSTFLPSPIQSRASQNRSTQPHLLSTGKSLLSQVVRIEWHCPSTSISLRARRNAPTPSGENMPRLRRS